MYVLKPHSNGLWESLSQDPFLYKNFPNKTINRETALKKATKLKTRYIWTTKYYREEAPSYLCKRYVFLILPLSIVIWYSLI